MASFSFLVLLLALHTAIVCSLASEVLVPKVRVFPLPREALGLPLMQAEMFIRALNLLPNATSDSSPVCLATSATADEAFGSSGAVHDGGRLVERRFRFPGLPSDGPSVEELGHHAGYYRLPHSHDARMFYLFFESRNSKDDPVLIWLSGGPGCSSSLALFYENGPFKLSDDMTLAWNDYGWDKVSNIIYVDQPIGTGFSYTTDDNDICYDENGISNHLYDFLQEFFKAHPAYAKNDFYITGESYGGHYIPALASRIQFAKKTHQGNETSNDIMINLKGFAIGNGLTNTNVQYKSWADYAFEMGLIEKYQQDRLNGYYTICEYFLNICGTSGTTSCFIGAIFCSAVFRSLLGILPNTNYYDIRKQCEGPNCYDFSNMSKFLNEKSVRDALGVGDREFVSCSDKVAWAMVDDSMRNLDVGIPALLEDGIKLLVYAGEYDLICNWIGNSRWVHAMEWVGQNNFSSSPELPFEVDGVESGVLKSYGPLSFLKVHDAGHMVPMDQPKAALEMLRRWIQGNLHDSPKEMNHDEESRSEL